MATVNLFHYRLEYDDEILGQYGSRYYGRSEAKKYLIGWALRKVGPPLATRNFDFDLDQLRCANEVYPEAALADPISDLQVWDEWRSGLRRFPHPGLYARLEITKQEAKTSATSSVGVLGEIFTGLLTQSYIAPIVSVRPIHRWPDFIFLTGSGYAFAESKATVNLGCSGTHGIEEVSKDILGDGLVDAVQELNTDPRIKVWLSFTQILNVEPIHAQVVMLETSAPLARQHTSSSKLPVAVYEGLKERILDRSAASAEYEEPQVFEDFEKGQSDVKIVDDLMKDKMGSHLVEILKEEVPPELYDTTVTEMSKDIRGWKPRSLNIRSDRRTRAAKQRAAMGRLSAIRANPQSETRLYIADLPAEEIKKLRNNWKPEWGRANQRWGEILNTPLWRCSSAILATGPMELQDRDISSIKNQGV